MNRRSFFNTIARVTAAASLSPMIFIPKFAPVKWKVIKAGSPYCEQELYGKWKFVVNPEYVNAPYEVGYHCHGGLFVPDGAYKIPDAYYPARYDKPDFDSEPIPPFLRVPA